MYVERLQQGKDVTMKQAPDFLARAFLLVLTWVIWWWALNASLSNILNVGGVLLVFPVVWIGRRILDQQPAASHAAWVTTFVHYAVGILLGTAMIRAIDTYQTGSGWLLLIPAEIGLFLVIVTGGAILLSMINLALKGLGAPFAIALSQKLAVDWLYAWTRNPMVLAVLAFLISLGIWFQSVPFVLWTLILFAPALLVFVKVYEERELEIRFGTSYLEYKVRTPMLFPRRPGRQAG
jgi:protein-S-isoprenylcysteine O-methyltransferase Ste14